MNAKQLEKLFDLLEALREETITDQQFAELDAMLSRNPLACRYYVEYTKLCANLRSSRVVQPDGVEDYRRMLDQFTCETADDPCLDDKLWQMLAESEKNSPVVELIHPKNEDDKVLGKVKVVSEPYKISKSSFVVSIASLAALIIMVTYVMLNPRNIPSSVGYLLSSCQAEWGGDQSVIQDGDLLMPGQVTLEKGLAELVMDSGARVVLEGPVTLNLETQSRFFLNNGKVSVLIHHGGEPFVVRTPSCSIVDFGTEFGVAVNSVGLAETHVFQGQVEMRSGTEPLKYDESLRLLSGQAGRIKSDTHFEPVRYDMLKFVSLDEYETRIKALEGSTYHRWKESIYRLHRDPSLVAHYFYEMRKDDPDGLFNDASATYGKLRGAFGGEGRQKPTWTQGRWPQKDAVHFERGKEQTIIIPADEALSICSPLTISTWVYFPNADQWGGHLISCRRDAKINYQFSLFDQNYKYGYQQNRFEFRQYNKPESPGIYSNEFIPQAGQWYHLAMTYSQNRINFYIDGQLFQSEAYKSNMVPVKAEIILGAMKLQEYILQEGDFDGIVDELMIFNRNLSENEIMEIYRDGKP